MWVEKIFMVGGEDGCWVLFGLRMGEASFELFAGDLISKHGEITSSPVIIGDFLLVYLLKICVFQEIVNTNASMYIPSEISSTT